MTCKLCRCFSRYAPCWNKLLSISLHIPFRLCFRVCSMLFFLTASCSGELRFLFFDILATSPCAKKTAILTSSMIATLFLLNCSPLAGDFLSLLEVFRSKNRQGCIFLLPLKMTFFRPSVKLSDEIANEVMRFSSVECLRQCYN